jgi:hypothetical protein
MTGPDAQSNDGPSAGLNALMSEDGGGIRATDVDTPAPDDSAAAALAQAAEESARLVEQYLASQRAEGTSDAPDATASNNASPGGSRIVAPTTTDPAPIQTDIAANPEATLANAPVSVNAAPDPEMERREAIALLARELSVGVAAGDAPFRSALGLLGLDEIEPGTGWSTLASALSGELAPGERRTIESLRDLLTRVAHPNSAGISGISGVPGDPAALADAYATELEKLASALPVRIVRAELCTRVEGFGQFEPIASRRLIAGRPHRMIVYVEVDRFAHRAIDDSSAGRSLAAQSSQSTGDMYEVELTQELRLQHDVDGALAMMRPAERVRESLRSVRRDFYVVQEIELPATLATGGYTLRVRMRDAVGGTTAEAAIGITLVADAATARAE